MRLRKILILILLTHVSCAVQPLIERKAAETIRIGIAEGLRETEFQTGNEYDVYAYDGTPLMSGRSGDRCKVQVISGTPATQIYRLVTKTTPDAREAAQFADELARKGYAAVIKKVRQRMLYNGDVVDHDMNYVCIDKEFTSETTAEEYRRTISSLYTKITPFMLDYPKGIVRLTNARNGDKVESNNYLRIVGDAIIIQSKSGQGFHFEQDEKRTYRSAINYVIDKSGLLTIVNDISIDDYLSGVVASEMNPKFPFQALKAQAVTARSYLLSHLGIQHPMDPYDVCDDTHCQVFSGSSRATADIANAVRETDGEVLMVDDKICETFYCGVCGGHTEHNENVWEGTPRPYLRGVFDLPSSSVNVPKDYLLDENNVKTWVKNEPRVYCNLNLIECPSYLEYTKKYFRWKVEYSQSEIRSLLEKKTGKSLGQITDIVPLERGISGRLKKIQINGTKQTFLINKELEIRRVFSESYLYSSCFTVEKQGLNDGIPQKFVIIGGGWGHGVGMCQTGAAVMALNGQNYRGILRHYYQGSDVKRIY